MRVLWFTNGPLAAVDRRHGRPVMGSGHWMSSLLDRLAGTPGVRLAVATAHPGVPDDRFEHDGVEYFVLRQPRLQSIFTCRKTDLERCGEIVREWKPDLIHIHGTERFYGLLAARNLVSTPAVLSLQGFLEPYAARFFGALSPAQIWRAHRLIEVATRRGLVWRYREMRAGASQEREILSGGKFFMGRTEWDRAIVRSHNTAAEYHRAGEVLRAPFYEALWKISECDRHTLIFTHAGEPRRGTEVLLSALKFVRREFPNARLRLGGSVSERRGYDRFVRRTIDEAGLSAAVDFLGYLDGNAMAAQLSRAHVFVNPSYIENSSNSLCEAMLVGVPSAAAYAGGTPSIISHGHNGWLFPPGDAPLLADAIVRIFRDDNLAVRLGQAARAEALIRHNPQRVVSEVLCAYRSILAPGGKPDSGEHTGESAPPADEERFVAGIPRSV